MNLTPQQQKIVDYLSDGRWHCMASGLFMKDDRKRISELNGMGYEIIGIKCDNHCGVGHSSRVLMRKMKATPKGTTEKPKEPELVWRDGRPYRVYAA